MTSQQRIDEVHDLAERVRRVKQYEATHRLQCFYNDHAYSWQRDIHNSHAREKMALCGNRTGKTFGGSADVAYHATGEYPDWWEGPRLKGPLTVWCLGVTNQQVRDVIQRELFGNFEGEAFDGTGAIPKERHRQILRSTTLSGLASEIFVKRKDNTLTRISLKAYTQSSTGQGTLALAGSNVDLVWVDEQPPDDVVSQLRTRTMTGNKGAGGLLLFTMTAELGETGLIKQFLEDRKEHQYLRQVAWDECPHLTEQIQKEMLETIPEWQREMRRTGMPLMGTGLIYPFTRERLECEPFEIPLYFKRIKAIDLGFAHDTAIAWIAYNADTDVMYLVRTYAKNATLPSEHTAVLRGMWRDCPTVFPHDGDSVEKGSGDTVRLKYREAGLENTRVFKNPDNTRYVEPGIIELYDRMSSGRLFVFERDNEPFWSEMRRYHRNEKGQIVKQDDDVMDAVRYAAMSVGLYGSTGAKKRGVDGKMYRNLGL